jgi:hypothetical protein
MGMAERSDPSAIFQPENIAKEKKHYSVFIQA